MTCDAARLKEALTKFSTANILVVGDVAIDEMIYGTTDRLSREAPVMILKHQRTDVILGAATNAAHNLASLGKKSEGKKGETNATVSMVGVVGDDRNSERLKDAMVRDGVDTSGLVSDPSRPTTTKTRISGMANHSVTQQIVRIDDESTTAVSGDVEKAVLQQLDVLMPHVDAVILSDYNLGAVTDAVIQRVQGLAKEHGIFLAVDSHRPLKEFQGATVLTPNQPEAERNVGYDITDAATLTQAGNDLLEQTQARAILLTRGEHGMSLFENVDGQITQHDIPVFNKSDVFDVTGAGDTVVATFTLACATGASMREAAVLGNLAASLVVRQFGAATTTVDELMCAIAGLPVDKVCA